MSKHITESLVFRPASELPTADLDDKVSRAVLYCITITPDNPPGMCPFSGVGILLYRSLINQSNV